MALQIRGSSQIKNTSISLSKLDTQGGTLSGNLTVSGDTVQMDVSTLKIEDSLLQLSKNNLTDFRC